MKRYIGVKLIEAEPQIKNFSTSDGGYGREGYKVIYPDGYVSWSPKDVFEEAYRPTTRMTFGLAIEAVKKGSRVARKGWNGKGMWLTLVKTPPTTAIHINGEVYGFSSYIQLKAADNKMIPWNASQADMLAEDWCIVD